MTIMQQRNLTINIINRINHKIRFLAIQGPKLALRRLLSEKLVYAVEMGPGGDLLESLADAVDFGGSYVCESGYGMAV